MTLLSKILIGFVAFIHLYIVWLEMFTWTTRAKKVFKKVPEEMFEKSVREEIQEQATTTRCLSRRTSLIQVSSEKILSSFPYCPRNKSCVSCQHSRGLQTADNGEYVKVLLRLCQLCLAVHRSLKLDPRLHNYASD